MLSVESAMRAYASRFGDDADLWGVVGLLHDFDYERYPDVSTNGHPNRGAEILREKGVDEVLVRPSRSILDVELKSVKKKWKDKAFAAPVNREEIEHAATRLGVTLDQHIEIVLEATKKCADRLGLAPSAS